MTLIAGNTLESKKILLDSKKIIGKPKPKSLELTLVEWLGTKLSIDMHFQDYKQADKIYTIKECDDKKIALEYYKTIIKCLKENKYKLYLKPVKLELS